MEEFEIEFKELDQFEIEDVREVAVQEVPTFPALENLSITPTTKEQVFNHENSYGYDEVRVEAVSSETLEISPTTENQEFNGMYSNVKVNAVTNEIDSNIVAENIKNDVEILGVKGSFVGEKFKPRYVRQHITFQGYTGTELDHETSMLDTTYFTDMNSMFNGCNNLTHLDLSGWNTSNVTKMNSMFRSLGAITELDLSNFDTSKVTIMSSAFEGCANLTRLNLSSWNTSKVTHMNYMFNNCLKLQYLDIRNFTFDSVISSPYMFNQVNYYCEIIVKSETEKQWIKSQRNFPNIKTVAELGE